MPYYLCFNESYRGDFQYEFVKYVAGQDDEDDEDDDKTPDHVWMTFDTEPSSAPFRVCIIQNQDDFEVPCELVDTAQTMEEAHSLMLQILAHVQDTGPFVSTGYTSSYKETGGYSDPVPVTNPKVIAFSYTEEKCTVAVVLNEHGDILSHLSIIPVQ